MIQSKKARDTATLVTLGSDLIKKIEEGGETAIHRMTVHELHALLVNANPLGSVSKPSKKVGIEKALQLDTVKTAILRHAESRPPPPPRITAPPPPTLDLEQIFNFLHSPSPAVASFPVLGPFAAAGLDPSDVLRTPPDVGH